MEDRGHTSSGAETAGPGGAADASELDAVEAGASIGRYVVIDEIGRGGMGRVLRAYDGKLHREVALKELRRERLGSAGTKRLIAEARAMAKLSHPNVVAVYDVEELAQDRVVLVMEYVAGQTLGAWLRRPRSWSERLACLRRAGQGLAAAHDAGVLHRDFKPDNVLVGDDGRVRVGDFGLARGMLPEHSNDAELRTSAAPPTAIDVTAAGMIVGTMAYLAPERLSGAPADTSSDQFAFCVTLWAALFGERPFVGRTALELALAMTSARPRPTSGSGVPGWLVDATARGLAIDPSARWPSMHALLTTLEQGAGRRRRRVLQAAAVLGVVGVAAVGVQAWVAARAQRCSEDTARTHLEGAWDEPTRVRVRGALLGVGASYASEVWTRSEPVLDAYADEWVAMHVDSCAATSVRGEQSEAVMDLRMSCLRRGQQELSAVTRALADADAQTLEKAHELTAGLPAPSRCADVEALQSELAPPLPADVAVIETQRTELALARAAITTGHYDAAKRSVEVAERELRAVDYAPVQSELALVRGVLLQQLGDYETSQAVLQDGLRSAARAHEVGAMQDLGTELAYVVGHQLQRFDEGLRYAELARGLAADDSARRARLAIVVATIESSQGKYDQAEASDREAIALLEHAFGPEHPDIVRARSNLAAADFERGKYDEAEAENRRVLALQEHTLGPAHPDVARTHHRIALVLHAEGELERAEAEHRLALTLQERALGADHPDAAAFRRDLAAVLQSRGEFAAAQVELERALRVQRRALGDEHPDVAATRSELAIVLVMRDDLVGAETELRVAISAQQRVLGADHQWVAQSRHNLANILEEQGRTADAELEHRGALATLAKLLDEDHPKLAASRTSLARLLVERGAFAEARELAEAAWQRRQGDDTPAPQRAHTAFVLAQALWPGGDDVERARAVELAARAQADYADSPEDAALVQQWRAQHRVQAPR